jgi:uncharacterized protein YbjQ (UPF0145 family)
LGQVGGVSAAPGRDDRARELLMFGGLKTVIVGAAAIITLIPGAGLLVGGLELPAPFNELLGVMAAVIGPIVFFLVYLARPWVERQPRARLMMMIAALGLGGLAVGFLANGYADARMGVYRYMTGDEEVLVRYLVPERKSDELRDVLARENGNITNALKRDRENTLKLLARDAASVRTKIVVGFLLAQTMLIVAFLSAAWAVAKLESSPSPDA